MSSESLNAALLCDLDLVTLERLLLATACIDLQLELVVVVGAEEGDQRGEVVERALSLGEF